MKRRDFLGFISLGSATAAFAAAFPFRGELDNSLLATPAQGEALDRVLPGFRYRVRMRVDLADPFSQPILESPVFEDATFAWRPATGAGILYWEP